MKITHKPGLTRLFSYLKPYKKQIYTIFITLTLTASSVLAIGYQLRSIINYTGQIEKFSIAILYSLALAIMLAIASFIRASAVNNLCESVISDVRQDLFAHLITLPPCALEKLQLTAIISKFTEECTLLTSNLGYILSNSLRNSLMFIGSISLLLYTSLKLSLFVFALIIAVILPALIFGKKLKKLSKLAQMAAENLPAFIEETIGYIRTVQAYSAEKYEIDRFNQITRALANINHRRIRIRSAMISSIIALVFMAVAIVIWIGECEIIAGTITAGDLMSFLFYAILAASSLGSLSEIYTDIQKAELAAMQIFLTLDYQTETNSISENIVLDKIESIEFKQVYFSYPESDEPILQDINLKILAGEKIAIIGLSGSGKSTILQLLLRFYTPTQGSIYINNIDINRLDITDLRRKITYISQEPVIFKTSIYQNVLYGKLDSQGTEVEKALALSASQEFVDKLPDKINSDLTSKGSNLSGGEKQRIALARGLIRDSAILLLDEPTASLDYQHEDMVLNNLIRNKTSNKTIAIIATHRLATIAQFDRIVVLEVGGHINAVGSHADLLQNNTIYQELLKLQFGTKHLG